MVPLVELGLETLALIHQEVVGLVDDLAEAVNGRGLALGCGEGPFVVPLSLLDPWVVVTSFDVNPLGGLSRIPHMGCPTHGLSHTSGQRRP